MKNSIGFFLTCLIVFSLTAGVFAQDPDTLDVAQGFETLNLAVEGDTLANGEAKNPNRVYCLERGGYYLCNGDINTVMGNPLRIVAAKGEGPRPILIPMADQTGTSSRLFTLNADGEFRDLVCSALDNLGNITKNTWTMQKEGISLLIDNCLLEFDEAAFVRMNASQQSLTVTNTILRNSGIIADPTQGRFFDTRGNPQEKVFIQNCTLYGNYGDWLRDDHGFVRETIIDHTTSVQTCDREDNNIMAHKTLDFTFTNNLLIDVLHAGDIYVASRDTLRDAIIDIEAFDSPEYGSDADRMYIIRNNVYGWTHAIQQWFDSIDSLDNPVVLDAQGLRLFANNPHWILENNLQDTVQFSDGPSTDKILALNKHRLATNNSSGGVNLDWRNDRNGISNLNDDPLSYGPAEDDYDFDYNTNAAAYTHGEGGFPVGDLNWFPDKKAEWEVASVVKTRTGSPTSFSLSQNYPNPFNPVTNIVYTLKKSGTINLTIFNSLGQLVKTLVSKNQTAGEFSVQWNGTDNAGHKVASGVYMYRLDADNQIQTKKMMLLR